MLDYYGSITKSDEEVEKEIIQKFRTRCHESYLKNIINRLIKEDILHNGYSVSGWYVFHQKNIYEIIEKTINYKKQKSELKLKFLYCYNQKFNDIDVCRLICDRI